MWLGVAYTAHGQEIDRYISYTGTEKFVEYLILNEL